MPSVDHLWADAKQKCRLNDTHIKIAKELNINPKSLIKNIPNKSEPWKVSVSDWIDNLYEKHQKKILQRQKRKSERIEQGKI